MIKCSKIKYPDGTGYCIYRVKNSDEDSGLCFDIFGDEEADEIINILQEYRSKEPEIYTPDTKYEEYIKKREKREKKWWHKIYTKYFENIGIQFTPFDWQFRIFPISKKNADGLYTMTKGIYLGPICITW